MIKTKKETIHVSLCFSDQNGEYTKYVFTVIAQILSHTFNPVMFHLVHDGTLQVNDEAFIENYITSHDGSSKFYNISKEPEFAKMNNGTLYRLFLPRLLPNINKVIYLDSDIFVMKDLNILWKMDVRDTPLVAVLDDENTQHTVKTLRYYKKQKINARKYFNAGILLMNLDLIRKYGDLVDRYLSYMRQFPHALMLDQDFLNYLFQDTTKFIPKCFNFISHDISDLTKEIAQNQVIVHLAGIYKPWNCRNPFVIEYFCHYYAENFSEEIRLQKLCHYMSGLPMRHFNKMKLNYALKEIPKNHDAGKALSLKCILKGILSDQGYQRAINIMTYIRLHFLYSFYYCFLHK